MARSEVAARLSLSVRHVQRVMSKPAYALAPVAYDAAGNARYDRGQAEAFIASVLAERAGRGEYRSRGLGACALPARRGALGRRLCAHALCDVPVTGRRKLCDAHAASGLNDQRLASRARGIRPRPVA